MKALVLSGGSIKGAFQAGAVAEVLKSGFVPEEIYGVSIGAVNGAFLADRAGKGDSPDWPAIGEELAAFWIERVTSFDVLGAERPKLGLGIAILRKKFKGLLKMKKADRLIEETVEFANIERFGKFFAGVVNVHSGEFIEGHTGQGEEKFFRHLIASTHEPIIKKIVWSEQGEPLADGGVRDIAPLGSAIKAGAREIIVIATQAEAVKDPKKNANYRDLMTLAKRTISVMTNEIVNNDLKLARYINGHCLTHGNPNKDFLVESNVDPFAGRRLVNIKVIRPEDPLDVKITEFDKDDIDDMIKKGRARAKAALAAQQGDIDFI